MVTESTKRNGYSCDCQGLTVELVWFILKQDVHFRQFQNFLFSTQENLLHVVWQKNVILALIDSKGGKVSHMKNPNIHIQ